ncbi:ABC transporter permease [Paenibacillus sp. 19GGS1-52]|uniref:ABC transporter permease n=1 Tax=Paenibacillus sp. 19GGS1-52 TaxID=2758563 RepID=UPI001EFB6139|nr:ABC transporter permease [Paenibacillus sp. 19GGS1-52]ULO05193.1 ABC transporter permease [Paenibacillus sp. 19GGS1-52]
MRSFNNLMLNEWLKLSKKRMFFVPYVLLILLPLLVGYIVHSVSADLFGSAFDFSSTMLLPNGIGQALTILAIIGTAGVVSKEYGQGTIKFLLIRARSRTAILASKYVVVLLYALTLTIVTTVAVYGSGILWFGLNGGEAGFTEILLSVLYVFVYTVVYATLAFMIGILTTSTGVTIGITMFAITIDKLVISREFYKYVLFPNLNLVAYKGDGAPMPGMTLSFSIVVLTVYMLLFLLAGFVVFRRRDVA